MSIGNSPADDRPSAEYDDRPSVGRALQKARIDSSLTVDEVSSRTRVRIPIVHAIEQDDFTRCGGDVYARGHIRTLARAMGIDPAPLIEQYDAEHGGRPAPTPAAPLFEAERMRPEPRRPNWTAAMVAAIVVVVAFVGFTLFSGGDEGGSTVASDTGSSQKPSSTPSAAKTKEVLPPEPSDSAIAAAPADKVTVKLIAQDGTSWVSAKDHSGRLIYEGVLKDGASETFTDEQQVDLVLGNAGAVQIFVNGKEIDERYEKGHVERLSYTKGDPAQG
ncbi:RodZ domain-containing protein [Streptomyces pathocidini]|uniref:Helix-turn-helix domain-containing protein n=1 Tax=Streptomyces pathocidini TaxID=1650571 RepID=A0ABW7UIK8_9ACTN|nr:helix-turn-helix domain-containing protein [Streptomyces pathocidini]